MISWIQRLLHQSPMDLTLRAADRLVILIAERSLADVPARLWSDLSEMSVAERRGYVRARAHHAVRLQARNLARENNLPEDSYELHVMRALERTTHIFLRQPATPAVMPLPRAHVQLRIAG